MDLGGWNTDFDSSLLNCWNDNTETNSQTSSKKDGVCDGNESGNKSSSASGQSSPRNETGGDGDGSWDGNLNARSFSRLPSFNMDYEPATSEKSIKEDPGKVTMNSTTSSQDGSDIAQRESQTGASSRSNRSSSNPQQQQKQAAHPRADSAPPVTNGSSSPAPVSTAVSEASTKDTVSTAGTRSVVSSASSSRLPQRQSGNSSSSTTSVLLQGSDGMSEGGGTRADSSSSIDGPRLHPLAIQSSANCPRHGGANVPELPQLPTTVGGMGLPYQYATQGVFPLSLGQTGIPINQTGGTTAASFADGLASLQRQVSQQLQQQPQHINATSNTSSTTTSSNHHPNFFLHPGTSPPNANTSATSTSSQQQLHRHPNRDTATNNQTHQHQHTVTPANSTTKSGPSSSSSSTTSRQTQQQQEKQDHENPPPFYLFDAPIELRANFMQSQRKLGIPITHDCNSYHYGETVKGFHPQLTVNFNNGNNNHHHHGHHNHLSLNPSTTHPKTNAPVQLIDARHGGNRQGAGRIKNEREQKRAQKITELIEQLRVNMENGGWKVEMRSKFHTLSSCADYVKHLTKTMKEKEEIVNKLKSDLQVKQREIEEDKALQESRSDPESVTSSLTSSTTGSGGHRSCQGNSSISSQEKATGNTTSDSNDTKKRKADSTYDESDNPSKKNCTGSSQNTSSVSTSEDSSGGEDRGGNGPGAQTISIDKTVSSVPTESDITDSNRGSSSNSGQPSTSSSGDDEESHSQEQPCARSISSDAAVASGKESQRRHNDHHKDVVFENENSSSERNRKRPPEEVTSLERSFELDYEEVFDNSNVPQLIASTSGKIVTWNDCFLKATGLKKSEVQRMTIFSLVKPDKLSNFFEIAAAALRTEGPQDRESKTDTNKEDETTIANETNTTSDTDKESETTNDESKDASERMWDYAAMTLPCIDFPAMKQRREASEPVTHFDPLYVTVTLMADEDPLKRCFHCVFTDCPGTNGALGSITPELLALLFTQPETERKKLINRNSSKRKRARTSVNRRQAQDTSKRNKVSTKQSSESSSQPSSTSSSSTNTEQQESVRI